MCMFFVSCKPKPQEAANTISVTLQNGVEEADFWVLPQTEKNVKSTVWGTPTASKLKAGERKEVSVAEGEKYIVRIIDTGHGYYAANDIVLGNGYSIKFKTAETKYEAALAVLDENGNTVSTNEHVFEGALGAN